MAQVQDAMFTGIVEEVGEAQGWQGNTLTVAAYGVLEAARVGDSIAVNGTCLTITALAPAAFTVHISQETRRHTNLGALGPADPVNLERPLSYGGRVGGHLVQGHVDATGTVAAITPEGAGFRFTFAPPRSLMPYIAQKGFVAIDGISLTVAERSATSFSVAVIPYTFAHTNLRMRRPGDPVNLEVDILAKYIEQLLRGEGRPRDSS